MVKFINEKRSGISGDSPCRLCGRKESDKDESEPFSIRFS
jgi:hypothetical protein